MAKTNTERQFNYRNEKINQGKKRLEVWLSQDHFDKIKELCDMKHKTRAQLIAELIESVSRESPPQVEINKKSQKVLSCPNTILIE